MAEQRKKTNSILLTVESKTISMDVFDAALWPTQGGDTGFYRVRIDGKWHSPTGKYSFLTLQAVGGLVCRLLFGKEMLQRTKPPKGLNFNTRIFTFVDGVKENGWVLAPPYLGQDARWWVWVLLPSGKLCVLADTVIIKER